jgi:opacity protein-like surface antigen
MKVTKSKLILFSVAVALISVFFFAYAVQSVYPAPEYEDFCVSWKDRINYNDEDDCVGAGGVWTDYEKDSEFGG